MLAVVYSNLSAHTHCSISKPETSKLGICPYITDECNIREAIILRACWVGQICCVLGLALAVYQEQLVILVVGNHLIKGAKNLRGTEIKEER